MVRSAIEHEVLRLAGEWGGGTTVLSCRWNTSDHRGNEGGHTPALVPKGRKFCRHSAQNGRASKTSSDISIWDAVDGLASDTGRRHRFERLRSTNDIL